MVIKGKYENKDGKIEEIPIRKEILGQGRMTRKEYMERRNLISQQKKQDFKNSKLFSAPNIQKPFSQQKEIKNKSTKNKIGVIQNSGPISKLKSSNSRQRLKSLNTYNPIMSRPSSQQQQRSERYLFGNFNSRKNRNYKNGRTQKQPKIELKSAKLFNRLINPELDESLEDSMKEFVQTELDKDLVLTKNENEMFNDQRSDIIRTRNRGIHSKNLIKNNSNYISNQPSLFPKMNKKNTSIRARKIGQKLFIKNGNSYNNSDRLQDSKKQMRTGTNFHRFDKKSSKQLCSNNTYSNFYKR